MTNTVASRTLRGLALRLYRASDRMERRASDRVQKEKDLAAGEWIPDKRDLLIALIIDRLVDCMSPTAGPVLRKGMRDALMQQAREKDWRSRVSLDVPTVRASNPKASEEKQ